MKRILSERNLVAALFVMVIVVFSFAQKDSRQLEEMYNKNMPATAASLDLFHLSDPGPATPIALR